MTSIQVFSSWGLSRGQLRKLSQKAGLWALMKPTERRSFSGLHRVLCPTSSLEEYRQRSWDEQVGEEHIYRALGHPPWGHQGGWVCAIAVTVGCGSWVGLDSGLGAWHDWPMFSILEIVIWKFKSKGYGTRPFMTL